MALADYHRQTAVAAAQVIAGFDETVFRETLEQAPVGLAIGADAERFAEGRALADLCIRLLARLYPRLSIIAGEGADELAGELEHLAIAINPQIDIANSAEIGVSIGTSAATFPRTLFAGSDQFDALVSQTTPQPVGPSANPFGAGAAACLACGALFRSLLASGDADEADVTLSTLTGERAPTRPDLQRDSWQLDDDAVLVGVGAIGNGALWALARARIAGTIHLVDDQTVELSNLQRYVLATRGDEGTIKVRLHPAPTARVELLRNELCFEEFADKHRHRLHRVMVALDSAEGRRRVQASLPLSIENAWTQPGDLGISRHGPFGSQAACLYCLYLPSGPVANEDQLVADALGIPDQLMEVRILLQKAGGVGRPLLEAIAAGLNAPLDRLLAFEGRTLRELYVEGLCGGAVLPLGQAGRPHQDVHVPLAHQSALAGVLLAAALTRRTSSAAPETTDVTRIDLLRPLQAYLTQSAAARGDGMCICEDHDYRTVFAQKWAERD